MTGAELLAQKRISIPCPYCMQTEGQHLGTCELSMMRASGPDYVFVCYAELVPVERETL